MPIMSNLLRSLWPMLALCVALSTLAAAQDGVLLFDSRLHGEWRVFRMAPDGSDCTPLTDEDAGGRYPVMGYDGLAFVCVQADGLAMRDLHDGELIWQIAPLTMRDLSINTARACLLGTRDGQLVVVETGTGDSRTLADAGVGVSRPSLTQDGGRIIYGIAGRGVFSARTADGQDVRQLIALERSAVAADHDFQPCVDRGAPRLAYIGEKGRLYLANADGTGAKLLDEGVCRYPAFSPNGRHIAYWLAVGDPAQPYWKIAIRNLDTGEVTTVGVLHPQPGSLCWAVPHECA
jgi:Tol biopolymer transport system component